VSDFCLGGGVAANPELRADLERELAKVGVRVTTPPFSACTDNAAMIGLAGYYALQTGRRDGFDLDADPHMSL
jgi:N6-L-threonylcarbamoyladenine synthase